MFRQSYWMRQQRLKLDLDLKRKKNVLAQWILPLKSNNKSNSICLLPSFRADERKINAELVFLEWFAATFILPSLIERLRSESAVISWERYRVLNAATFFHSPLNYCWNIFYVLAALISGCLIWFDERTRLWWRDEFHSTNQI